MIPGPWNALRMFDVILVNSSAGKDSQAMLDVLAEQADRAGVLNRVTVLHCDLGEVEWPGTPELAAVQADHYGLRFEVRRREGGGLLDMVRERYRALKVKADREGKPVPPAWPSAKARYCTSALKRGPGRKLITQLVGELGITGRPARVLNCLGLRAEESKCRAGKPAFALDEGASSGRRTVWTWHPLLHWSRDQVWERINASGVPYHYAYDLGMTRASCSLCVLASRCDLIRGARHRPELVAEYAALEAETGYSFRADLSVTELIELANA